MVRFLATRLATAAMLAFLVLVTTFFIIRAVPGDPAQLLATGGGQSGQASEDAVELVREQLGLDRPLAEQFFSFVGGVLQGDLGTSFTNGASVVESVANRLPNTVELVVAAALLGTLIGVVLGAVAARYGRVWASAVLGYSSLFLSIPVFVLGVLLVYLFAVTLGLLPAGSFTAWERDPVAHVRGLVLPVVSLSLPFSAVVARMTYGSIVDVGQRDWVRTARSWGMQRGAVFRAHQLRNSLTPVLTTVGLELGSLLGGTVLVERVFSYPGLSSLLIDGINDRDYPVVQGVVICIAVLFILLNIVIDAAYGLLDPKVRA